MFSRYRRRGDWQETPSNESRLSGDAQAAEEKAKEHDGETVMRIGRYRGRTFDDVARNTYYVRWVRSIKYPSGQMRRLREYLDRNAQWLLNEQVRQAREAGGTLSKRVRMWPLDEFRELGILHPLPQVNNCTVGQTRRPRPPVYGLQGKAGPIPPWEPGLDKLKKWRIKCLTGLVGRFMSYVFRRMVHQLRTEPLRERVIADKALEVLERNDYAYRLALKLASPPNDPEGTVELEALEEALQERRAKLKSDRARVKLPLTLRPCFSRLGKGKTSTTPRAILLRFMMSLGALRDALECYRDGDKLWSEESVLRACWTMARADGAFNYDRITNEDLPPALLDLDLPIYGYMGRVCRRHFLEPKEVTYGACVGFGDTGCPVEADMVIGDTVWAFRSGLWISNKWDFAYLQGYAALARIHGKPITRACVAYFQHGCVLSMDLEDWDHVPLLDFLRAPSKRVEGLTEAEAEGNACDLGMCEEAGPDLDDVEEKEQERQQKHKRRAKTARGHQALA